MPTLAELAKKKKPSKPRTHGTLPPVPWAKVAAMYRSGQGGRKIADSLKLHSGPGSKPECRYSRIANILTALSKGVMVDSKVIRIDRRLKAGKK